MLVKRAENENSDSEQFLFILVTLSPKVGVCQRKAQ